MINWLSNLRVRFLGLVLVAVLPALGLLIISASEQRSQAVKDARASSNRLVNAAAADQNRVISSTRQLLVVLSRLPEIRQSGPTCDTLMASLLSQFDVYDNLGVVARDGELTCSAVEPSGPVNLGGQRFVQGAISSFAYTVSQYQTSPVTGNKVLYGGFPVVDSQNNTIAIVYASIDLEKLASDFTSQDQLADGEILTVFDANGTALLRKPSQADFVGRSLLGTPVVVSALTSGPLELNGGVSIQNQIVDGQNYLYAYAPLGDPDNPSAYISIARLESDVVSPAEQAFSRNLTRLGLVVVVILIGAWVGADLLIRRDTDAYKVLVQRIYDAFGSGSVDLLDEVVADDFRDHDPMPGQTGGLAGLKQAVSLFRAAFPDGEMLVDHMIAEGDTVVSRVTLRGTQRGDFFGLPANGRIVSAEGIEIYRIANGKIVEGWSRFVPPLLEDDDDAAIPIDLAHQVNRPPDLTVGAVAGVIACGLRRRLRRDPTSSDDAQAPEPPRPPS